MRPPDKKDVFWFLAFLVQLGAMVGLLLRGTLELATGEYAAGTARLAFAVFAAHILRSIVCLSGWRPPASARSATRS